MGEHAPQASQVIISSSRTPGGGRVQVYQNFSLFCNTIRNVGRFGLWWVSGPPTCSYSTWLWIRRVLGPLATRPTRTPIASVAPNSAANAAAGLPTRSTNLKVKQADAVMLSYPLGVQYPPPYDTTTRTVCASHYTAKRQPLRALKDTSWQWTQRCSPPHLPLQFNPNTMDGHRGSLAQKCTSRKAACDGAVSPHRRNLTPVQPTATRTTT